MNKIRFRLVTEFVIEGSDIGIAEKIKKINEVIENNAEVKDMKVSKWNEKEDED